MLQFVLGLLMAAVEVYWAVAFGYAYQQLRERRLLLQVVQGVLLTLFFGTLAINGLRGLNGIAPVQIGLLLVVLLVVVFWRMTGGPELLRERYTNRLSDVLRLRRPAVDLRRRVRSK